MASSERYVPPNVPLHWDALLRDRVLMLIRKTPESPVRFPSPLHPRNRQRGRGTTPEVRALVPGPRAAKPMEAYRVAADRHQLTYNISPRAAGLTVVVAVLLGAFGAKALERAFVQAIPPMIVDVAPQALATVADAQAADLNWRMMTRPTPVSLAGPLHQASAQGGRPITW